MDIRNTALTAVAAALSALAVIGASAAPALAEEEGGKKAACAFIGCPGDNSQCADIAVTVEIPGVGSASVTYYCKEANAT